MLEDAKEAEDGGRDEDALPEVEELAFNGDTGCDDDLERGRLKEDKADEEDEGNEASRKMWICVCGVMCALKELCLDFAIGCVDGAVVVKYELAELSDVELKPFNEAPFAGEVLDKARVSGLEGFRKKDPAVADQVVCDDIGTRTDAKFGDKYGCVPID